jgi:hypothetical protein
MKRPLTVKMVLNAARKVTPRVRSIEVGLRERADGALTGDCTQWAKDADLADNAQLKHELHKHGAGAVLDLYLYDSTSLILNLDLRLESDHALLVDPFDPRTGVRIPYQGVA